VSSGLEAGRAAGGVEDLTARCDESLAAPAGEAVALAPLPAGFCAGVGRLEIALPLRELEGGAPDAFFSELRAIPVHRHPEVSGVKLYAVRRESAAGRAGLRNGDHVVAITACRSPASTRRSRA
jgi:hypothetical protein